MIIVIIFLLTTFTLQAASTQKLEKNKKLIQTQHTLTSQYLPFTPTPQDKVVWTVKENAMSQASIIKYLDLTEIISQEIPQIKTIYWSLSNINDSASHGINQRKSLDIDDSTASQIQTVKNEENSLINLTTRPNQRWTL